jgi:putative FmdB family regulatory protein
MIYEFRCKNCGVITQGSFPISSDPKKIICKKCKGEAERIVSKTTFILKGKGWAKDGYSRKP